MTRRILVLIVAILCFCCESKKETFFGYNDLVGEWELIKSDTTLGLAEDRYTLSAFGFTGFSTLMFHEDSTMEPYYKSRYTAFPKKGPHILKFLGRTTRFKIINDSIRVINPPGCIHKNKPDNKPVAVRKLTKDSLVLDFNKAIISTYKRVYQNLDTMPTFDAIILSSSWCLGPCPISSTLIKSDGSVVYLGESTVERTGLYTGTITKKTYNQIQDYFRRADIKNIDAYFESPESEGGRISITFIKDGKIYKSIIDDGGPGPEKLMYAYAPLLFLNQYTDLKKVVPEANPPHQDYAYRAFIKGNQIIKLSSSEAFLLWDYLRQARISQQKVTPRFNLGFIRNALGVPSEDDMEPETTLPEVHLSEIITDA